MRVAFTSIVDGTGDQPPRAISEDGSALAMMAKRSSALDGDGGIAFKLVSVWPPNRELGLPTTQAIALWFDAATRSPHLLIEGGSLTSLRTGAASGLATDLLADPDAATLAMIGAGGQAADQVRAVCTVRSIREVKIFSQHGASAQRLVDELRPLLPDTTVRYVPSARMALADADVVCCATNATSPVISDHGLAARVHINAVGAYRPMMCELPKELLAHAQLVVVDELEAALAESGEIIGAVQSGALAVQDIVELGNVIGTPPALLHGITVFKSVGIALQDWAICRLLSQRVPADTPTVRL
jgi:ornithine cyclodeaminase